MFIRDRLRPHHCTPAWAIGRVTVSKKKKIVIPPPPVSYTKLQAPKTQAGSECRLLLEKKNKTHKNKKNKKKQTKKENKKRKKIKQKKEAHTIKP